MNKENFFQGAKKAILAGSVAAIASGGGMGPRPAEAGDPQGNSKVPANPGIVQRSEFGQGYTGPRFTVEPRTQHTNIFAQPDVRGEAIPTQETVPLDQVIAGVRVPTGVRIQHPLKDLNFTRIITSPDKEFRAGFIVTTGAQNGEWDHRIYTSKMEGGRRTPYERVTGVNIPIGIHRESAFFPSGSTFTAGAKGDNPSLLFAPNYGRDVNGQDKQWLSVPIQNNHPRGWGEVISIKAVETHNPQLVMNRDIAVFGVTAGGDHKGEIQIVVANGNTVEAPIRTGLQYTQVREVISAKTIDGNTIEMLINTDEGLAAAIYDIQGRKIISHAIIHKGGFYRDYDSYQDVDGQQTDVIINQLDKQVLTIKGTAVVENSFGTWLDNASLPDYLPGSFSLRNLTVTITDKGSKRALAIGSRNVLGQEPPVPVAVEIHPFIPGKDPDPKDIRVMDISQIKGGVTFAKGVKMMGNPVIEFDQRGVAHSTLSYDGTVIVTDKGVGDEHTETSTPNRGITYNYRMGLPMAAQNGVPSQAQATRR